MRIRLGVGWGSKDKKYRYMPFDLRGGGGTKRWTDAGLRSSKHPGFCVNVLISSSPVGRSWSPSNKKLPMKKRNSGVKQGKERGLGHCAGIYYR